MPELKLTLIMGDKVSENTDYRDALAINMTAVPRAILNAQGYMRCYPGITKRADVPGLDRGAFYNDRFGEHYRVSGTKLIEVDAADVVTELGTIPGLSQASMTYSFSTQMVVADGRAFLYSPTGGFAEITDIDLGTPLDVVWINGYYFFTDGENIYHTDITDETSIDPLKFATAEFMPDISLAVAKTPDNKVMVFGRYSIEYFVDAATEDFAFTRLETRAQKIGIVATHAKAEANGTHYIVGSRRDESLGVHAIGTGSSKKVSTREVDKILAQYTEAELADIRMECRTEDDISLIIIHLPNECLCFNVTVAGAFGLMPAWSLLQTGYEAGARCYRGINAVYDQNTGTWCCGDKYTNVIGCVDNTVFTQYDEQQEWYMFTPFVNMETLSINELEIETIPGFTDTDDAKVAVATTYDGINYSMEEWVMYGDPLAYNQRFKLYRLGYVDDWIGFRFRSVTKSKMAFAGITLDYG